MVSLACLLLISQPAWAISAADYLPVNANLDPAIPTPESVLGWDVGDWHVSHDQLLDYMQRLSEASPRISLKVIGQTFEQRDLLQLAITSESNQGKLASLREAHLSGEGPLVVWLGYSIHGNEPSGSNASMLVAYYLAAARSDEVQNLLEGSVILLDPSFNPDGLNRYASWANSNAGSVPVSNPLTRQHVEHWPGGRTNHYWFDLNRDWLPLVQPESRARVTQFQWWRPHVLTDHHEQDNYAGLFFQPGVPTRTNPLIPDRNVELTRTLAGFHAQALHRNGQPYFAEDAYDDFYFGKGSTYPDINGGIGILFEQRAILGQELETSNGTETFKGAVANHLAMSLSTLEGAWAHRQDLKAYRQFFVQQSRERASRAGFKAWVMGDDGDPERAQALLDVFELHRIEYQVLNETLHLGDRDFVPGKAWVFPLDQPQFALLEAMMEQRTTFDDQTFYDVSAWTQPLAYNLPFARLNRIPSTTGTVQSSNGLPPPRDVVAWIISWNQLNAPSTLQSMLDAGIRVRTSMKPFSVQTDSGLQAFGSGSLVILPGTQPDVPADRVYELISQAALSGLAVHGTHSMLTAVGPDLGSQHFPRVEPIAPLIIGGEGISSSDTGEAWFLLDQRLNIAAPMAELYRLDQIKLNDYTHLLMQDGDYTLISESRNSDISRWVLKGGVLVATGRAALWAETLCFEDKPEDCHAAEEDTAAADDSAAPAAEPYGAYASDEARLITGGAIVSSRIDPSHPLGFGYARPDLPLFRRGTVTLAPASTPYSSPVIYNKEPLLAGFIGAERLEEIRDQPAVTADKRGEGLVVRFANNALFRGFWRGTERMYINALYFGQVVEPTELPK